jgi:hypothetical protein
LKEERERIERGARWEEKGERSGSFWQNRPLLPLPRSRTWREGDRPGGRSAGALAGGPVHGDDREMGQNGEDAEGISAPCSPCAMVACRGGSAGGGGLEVAVLGGRGALVLRKEGARLWPCGVSRGAVGPYL